MKCDHEYDDGSYVLGALSPAERASYERHLSTCSFCREAVADIAVLPGLLGRLDPADFAKLLDPALTAVEPEPHDRVPELMTAARVSRRRERLRGRRQLIGAVLAAACLAMLAGFSAVLLVDPDQVVVNPPPPQTVAMTPVAQGVPISAGINITDTAAGTQVYMVCTYAADAPSPKSYTFRLMAYGPDDQEEQVGSWLAAPGQKVEVRGMTRFSGGSLSRLQLIRYDDQPLLGYNVP